MQVSNSRPRWFEGDVLELYLMYPEWSLVRDYKDGKITPMEYVERYVAACTEDKVQQSIVMINDYAIAHNKSKVILVCWEGPGKFCHRYKCSYILTGLQCEEI